MEDGSGGRNRQYGETNGSGLTLGGILSIKQTPPYRIHDRTLLDLIRDDQISGKESKNTWKMFREKLRLKLSGSGCATTAPTLASHVHVHVTADGNRIPMRNDLAQLISVSSPVNNTSSVTNLPVADTQTVNVETETPVLEPVPEIDRVAGGDGDGGELMPTPARMSLMSLLEVEGAAYFEGDDVEEEEEEVVAVEEDGDCGVGGGGYKYNYCCVCMVRHKGAAFIPCGHTFCRLCSRELFVKRASCPLCNNLILEILDIF